MKQDKKKRNRIAIAGGAAVVLILLNLFMVPDHLMSELEIYNHRTQTMYDPAFLVNGQYPDMFLRVYLKDRTVCVSQEIKTYDMYGTYGKDDMDGNPFDRNYLIENDYTLWFRQFADKVEVDNDIVSGNAVSENFVPVQDEFIHLGQANDMLRYAFPLNKEHVQQATAFWYSWYYHAFAEKREKERGQDLFPDVYVNLADDDREKKLVAVWGPDQDLYLMGEDYYESVIADTGKEDAE